MQIRYFKRPRQHQGQIFDSHQWGDFLSYIEIADQYVSRQVDVYPGGQILRYTRTHWCDDYGAMLVGRFSRKQKAANGSTVITNDEFERLWKKALESDWWEHQLAHSREDQWGTWEERIFQ